MPCTGSTSMFGILRAARAKLASSSAPSMISALVSPSLAKLFCSALVLPFFTVAFSSTMMPPSLALADNACLSASARTFLGRSIAWLRGVGPNERPPPRKRLTRAGPWRAGRAAVAGGAGALLPVHLLAGAVDLAAVLDVVGAALTLGELPAHAAMQDVRPRLEAEDRVRQFDRTRRLAVERHDLELHVRRPP